MTSQVLVLGGGGFIGTHLCRLIDAAGFQVTAAVRHPSAQLPTSVRQVCRPYATAKDFRDLIASTDAVIHAASSSTPSSSDAKPQLENTLGPSLALLEALQDAPEVKLIYLSSGGTLYGSCASPAPENTPLQPGNYHAAGKIAVESFIQAYARQFSGRCVILRPSNVYGPGQYPRQGFGIIPASMAAARTGMPIPIWGDGKNVRDYLYIDDFCEACLTLLQRRDRLPSPLIINLATSRGVTLDELLAQIEQVSGRRIIRQLESARRVDVRNSVPDASVARRVLNWKPRTRLEEGLRKTWEWHLRHVCPQ